jgi:deoxycytidylate deaminase
MDICTAVHGEIAALLQAAIDGVSTMDGVLFISCALPCKDCMKEIIRAGIKYIVSPYKLDYVVRADRFADAKLYNFPLSRQMMEECGIEWIHEPRLVKGR